MNINCLSENGFNSVNNQVMNAYRKAAILSMKQAAVEMCAEDITESTRVRVTVDGSWRKRGHNSLNGVVTLISGGKSVDVEVLLKHCKGCKMWEGQKGAAKYNCWNVEHNCDINHVKSSGAMESAGAVNIFKRSVNINNLIYHE